MRRFIEAKVKGFGPWVAYYEAGFIGCPIGRHYTRYPFRWIAALDVWSYLHMNFFMGHIGAQVVGKMPRGWLPQSERTGA